jgi:hypothetical protein
MINVAKHLSLLINKSIVNCEGTEGSSFDPLFQIHIPHSICDNFGTSRTHVLHGIAHRCMHDLCWFKPARAYILGLYLDTAVVNRIKAHVDDLRGVASHLDCPKTFVLFFASDKDLQHIRKGFERSYVNFVREKERATGVGAVSGSMSMISRFLRALDDRESLKKGDRLEISCIPSMDTMQVTLTGMDPVVITEASLLIEWMHSLYLGLESKPEARYRSIQEKLIGSNGT